MPDIVPEVVTKLYAVYDTVAKDILGGIIRAPNDEVARRSFHELLKQKDSPVAANRGDYNLLYLGDINNHGELATNTAENPVTIARGQDWLDANKEN